MGDDLTGVSIDMNLPDSNTTVCTLSCSDCSVNGTMPDGQLTTWSSTACNNTGSQGSRFKADILFTYTGSGGLSHTKTGSMTTQVE